MFRANVIDLSTHAVRVSNEQNTIESHRPSTLDASFTIGHLTPQDEDCTNSCQVDSQQENECTTSQANVITLSPSSSRESSIPSALPWSPRHLQGRVSRPERRRCEYAVHYLDHAVLDPKANGSQKDAASGDILVDRECASMQQSAGNDPSGQPRREISKPSEWQNGRDAISRPGHAMLDPYHDAAGSNGQGMITAGNLASVVILGLTVAFLVGVVIMKKQR